MKIILTITCLSATALIGLGGCGSKEQGKPSERKAAAKVSVIASIPPHGYFIKRIGDDYVDWEVMVPAGSDPHTFEST